jgi:hypothetical protein
MNYDEMCVERSRLQMAHEDAIEQGDLELALDLKVRLMELMNLELTLTQCQKLKEWAYGKETE